MKKVLLIDDEVSFVEMVRLLLEKDGGYEVCAEYRGEQGREIARAFLPDIIILDMMMAQTNSTEVLKNIREDEKIKDTPVIILSALKSSLIKPEAEKYFVKEYLEKPITVEKLKKKINEILQEQEENKYNLGV